MAAILAGCGPPPTTGSTARPIVYGADDRRDLFDVDGPEVRARVAASVVALVPRKFLRPSSGGVEVIAPSWGEQAGLCAGERFRDQPAAAFCTGVLVDWDLVLTAGHCARALALPDFAVVFGYYYAAPGKLDLAAADVFDVAKIAAESLAPAGVRPRIAYAWLRLGRPAQPPRAPAPVRLSPAGLRKGQPLIFAGAGGGVPLKIDAGGSIADLGQPWSDFFVANTDSFHGASGGGAFDEELVLLGSLERGGPDLVTTGQADTACRTTLVETDAQPEEELTFAYRAREALCAGDLSASSLCRPDCGDPCVAAPLPPAPGAGCALAGRPHPPPPSVVVVGLLLGLARAGRARRRGARG